MIVAASSLGGSRRRRAEVRSTAMGKWLPVFVGRSLVFSLGCWSPISLVPVVAQEVRDSSGIVVTSDTARAARIDLEALMRIGSFEGEGPESLGRVHKIAVDQRRGEVFVADASYQVVKVFGVDGEFQRLIGREGQGPGEFSNISGVAVARDTVVVTDGIKVHTFTRRGEHIGSGVLRTALGVTASVGVVATAEGWVVWMREIDPDRPTPAGYWRAYAFSPGKGLGGEWIYQQPEMDEDVNFVIRHRPQSTVHGDGFIDSPESEYVVRRMNASGEVTHSHRFVSSRVPITPAFVRRFRREARERCGATRRTASCLRAIEEGLSEIDIGRAGYLPVIGGLVGSDVGRVLVQRNDLDPTPMSIRNGDETVFDLISDNGSALGRVEFPEGFVPLWLGATEIWGVDHDEFDVPYIVGFRYALN